MYTYPLEQSGWRSALVVPAALWRDLGRRIENGLTASARARALMAAEPAVAKPETQQAAPRRLGGWLIVAAVHVVLGPVLLRARLLSLSETLAAGSSASAALRLGTTLALGLSLLVAVDFFRRKHRFVPLAVALLATTFILDVAQFLMARGAPAAAAPFGSTTADFADAVIWTTVALTYLLSSRRVRETFVR